MRRLPKLFGTPSLWQFDRLVVPFVLMALVQAVVAWVSLDTLSSVRAYVGGESIWSRSQKDAIRALDLYLSTGEHAFYQRYERSIAVPLGDLAGRHALEANPPDLAAAREGFLQGGNDPADVPGIIWLYRYFRDISYMANAIKQWVATDSVLHELTSVADAIRLVRDGGPLTKAQADVFKSQLDDINRRLTPRAEAFSASLGAGSRAITALLSLANLITAAVLISLMVAHAYRIGRQRRQFQQALHNEKVRAQTTLASIGDAVLSIDGDGCLDYMNQAAEELIACRLDDARGRPLSSLLTLIDQDTGQEQAICPGRLGASGTGATGARSKLVLHAADRATPVSVVGAELGLEGAPAGMVVVIHDMTHEYEYIARLSWQASHDTLTSLVNRREFEHQLSTGLAQIEDGRVAHALLFIDLDQFKVVNDTCGHAAGDKLLRDVAAVLHSVAGEKDVIARLGGDEFAMLLQDCAGDEAARTGEQLRRAIDDLQFVWGGRSFRITASIGLVHLSRAGITVEDALRMADVACYAAKEGGRNRLRIHEPDANLVERVGEMAWLYRIHEALEHDLFCFEIQEIVALDSAPGHGGRGRHVELLLRLGEPDGVTPPLDFLPAAERYGLMPLIDRWVVRHAFDAIASGRLGTREVTTCAINLGAGTFGDTGFVDFVAAELKRTGVRAAMICFEIAEAKAIGNLASAQTFIQSLRALGCRFALDDFGIGMASFGYLKQLPVDYLKIDGSFIRDMLEDPLDHAMVEMIHRIGRVTGKMTIAESVESRAALDALRFIGVDKAQGFAVAQLQPLPLAPKSAETVKAAERQSVA